MAEASRHRLTPSAPAKTRTFGEDVGQDVSAWRRPRRQTATARRAWRLRVCAGFGGNRGRPQLLDRIGHTRSVRGNGLGQGLARQVSRGSGAPTDAPLANLDGRLQFGLGGKDEDARVRIQARSDQCPQVGSRGVAEEYLALGRKGDIRLVGVGATADGQRHDAGWRQVGRHLRGVLTIEGQMRRPQPAANLAHLVRHRPRRCGHAERVLRIRGLGRVYDRQVRRPPRPGGRRSRPSTRTW